MKNLKDYVGLKLISRKFNLFAASSFILLLFLISQGCQKSDQIASPSSGQATDEMKLLQATTISQVNLDADVSTYDPAFIDPNLVNAWGMAISDEGEIWVSAADKGLAFIFDGNGAQLESPIGIPFGGDPMGGAPTGAMYNGTETFFITAANEKSEFIYATENGTIVAAVEGTAYTVADRSAFDAVYKGLAIAKSGGSIFLYATNFKQNQIDVFDEFFNYVGTMPFIDPTLPAGYAPFNIRLINGYLYVTYAKQLGPDNEDDEAGPGHGYVDIFSTDGIFAKRFASEGTLNSPWGIVEVPGSNQILVGNFGSGKISIFSPDGTFMSNLKSNGTPVEIEGLWAITFPGSFLPPSQRNRLYFTAGPAEETHGIFGYLTAQ